MAKLDAMGCTIVLTADHGMNAKFGADGKPDVIYLQDVFDGWLGKDKARVILPITDPYVVHHGALGSFAVVYLPSGTTTAEMAARLKSMPGIEAALSREEAAQRFELPADRLGDLVVVSTKHKVLGTSAARHAAHQTIVPREADFQSGLGLDLLAGDAQHLVPHIAAEHRVHGLLSGDEVEGEVERVEIAPRALPRIG